MRFVWDRGTYVKASLWVGGKSIRHSCELMRTLEGVYQVCVYYDQSVERYEVDRLEDLKLKDESIVHWLKGSVVNGRLILDGREYSCTIVRELFGEGKNLGLPSYTACINPMVIEIIGRGSSVNNALTQLVTKMEEHKDTLGVAGFFGLS